MDANLRILGEEFMNEEKALPDDLNFSREITQQKMAGNQKYQLGHTRFCMYTRMGQKENKAWAWTVWTEC